MTNSGEPSSTVVVTQNRARVRGRSNALLVGLIAVASLTVAACSPNSDSQGGGSADLLRVATDQEPSTFDWHVSGSKSTALADVAVLETLYAVDETYTPVPQLASEMPTVTEDGLVYNIPLRTDVVFHDGSTMQAADVVASLERWGRVAFDGKPMFEHVDHISALSDSEVQIALASPYDVVRGLAVTANPAVIMPAKVVEAAGDKAIEGIKQIVGTGPYKLVGWDKGQRYVLERFADYHAANNGAKGGLASARRATYKRVEVIFVADPTTRVQSTLAGQYDVAINVPGSLYDDVNRAENVSAQVVSPFFSVFMMLNDTRPPFDNPKARTAAALALDRTELGDQITGSSKVYSADPAFYPKGMGVLSTDAGDTNDSRDIARAKSLLEEAGYNGEPVHVLTSRAWSQQVYEGAIAVAQQFTAAGFNVKIDELDEGPAIERYYEKDAWHIIVDNYGVDSLLPPNHGLLNGAGAFPGWYAPNAAMKKLFSRWHTATSDEERSEVMDAIKTQVFRDSVVINLIDFSHIMAVSDSVDMGDQTFLWPAWWSAKLR